MRVLSIGSDRRLFKPDSDVAARMVALGDRLEIIIFSTRAHVCHFVALSDQVKVYPTNSHSRWFYIWDAVKIGKKLFQPDLVTAQDPFECGLAGWLLAKFFDAKLQLQIHTDFLEPHFLSESLLNRLRVTIAHLLIPRADKVRVVSQRIADSIKRRGWKLKSEPVVLPVFVDVEEIRRTPIKIDLHKKYPQFEKIILMASRLTREKNIGLAIGAMSAVLQNFPKTGLIIVGSGPESEKLKAQRAKLGLEKNVIFEDWTDDLISYYKTTDLFLLTSNYEGYGRTIVEALAAGCPVISTDVGLVGEAGYRGLITSGRTDLASEIGVVLFSSGPEIKLVLPYAGRDDYLLWYKRACLN